MPVDLLGRDLEGGELRLLAVYTDLKAVCGDATLPPTATENARAALAQLAQALNSLAIVQEHAPELGI